jgi:hypothetical protein
MNWMTSMEKLVNLLAISFFRWRATKVSNFDQARPIFAAGVFSFWCFCSYGILFFEQTRMATMNTENRWWTRLWRGTAEDDVVSDSLVSEQPRGGTRASRATPSLPVALSSWASRATPSLAVALSSPVSRAAPGSFYLILLIWIWSKIWFASVWYFQYGFDSSLICFHLWFM